MKEILLYAPAWYWKLPVAEREKGRCGAGDGLGEKLVPETIWGLNITPACQIHDKMYAAGKTINDKDEADRAFLNNMLRLIDGITSFILLRWLRRQRALTYYNAVKDFGGPAFWANKNKPEEWGATQEDDDMKNGPTISSGTDYLNALGMCLLALMLFSGCSNIQIKSPAQKQLAAIGIKYSVNKILAKRPDISEEMLIAARSLKTAINEGLPLSLLDSILEEQIVAAKLPPEDERLLLDLAILCYETVEITDSAGEQKNIGLLLADVVDQAIVEWQSSMAGAVYRSTEAIKNALGEDIR